MEYFDFNATTPVCDEALEALMRVTRDFHGNPSSLHRVGRRADHILDESRHAVAEILGCQPAEIVWTSGATESNNMVFNHLSQHSPAGATVLISDIEHPCVRKSAHHYFGDRAITIPVTPDGVVDLQVLDKLIADHRPVCVSVMASNNETGMLQPWQDILNMCRSAGVLFHCDAAQWLGKMPGAGLGQCDFVSGASHKFTGPKGVGFLKMPAAPGWNTLIHGGGQEEGRRAGTENVAGVAAMTQALVKRNAQVTPDFITERQEIKKRFLAQILDRLPGSMVIGKPDQSLWNTVMIVMPDTTCQQRWVVKLDKGGYAVSSGSACSSGQEKPSMVLTAMGFTPSHSSRALRFSGGWETSEAQWMALADALVHIHDQIRESGGE